MVEVKPIDVCCSSQDPAFPALNLVRGALKPSDERKQWLCLTPDEKFAHVVLTYEKPFVISSLEIKNNGSAYVQVEGANSDEPSKYKVLWRTQSLMTPHESRQGTETDGIYIFLPQDLAATEKDKTWDVLKITCSQPFNKLQKYGLSHVIARSALPVKEEIPSSPSPCVAAPSPRVASPIPQVASPSPHVPSPSPHVPSPSPHVPSPSPRVATPSPRVVEVPITGVKMEPNEEATNAAQVCKQQQKPSDHQSQMNSEVSSSGCSETSNSLTSPVKQEAASGDEIFFSTPRRPEPSSSVHGVNPVNQQQDMQSPPIKRESSLHVTADSHSIEDEVPTGTTSVLKRRISESEESSDTSIDEVQVVKRPAASNIMYKPFNKLLEGVKFTISGFENPARKHIRDKALEMGASYSPFWNDSCTHLVCAFLYTPKYRQAAADHGLIVTRDWVDQCHLQRKRLPWRRFALNPSERSSDCGGLEIWELQPSAASSSSSQNNVGSSTSPSNPGRLVESSPVRVICSNQSGPSILNRSQNNSLSCPYGPSVKREVLDRGDSASDPQSAPVENCSAEGPQRPLVLQHRCTPSPRQNVTVKREMNNEDVHDAWHDMSCGTEPSQSRRSQASNMSPRHHLLYSSASTAVGGEHETHRPAGPNSSSMEPGSDGYAGYYRPISQPCAAPHSSPSATYLVPPVIMLPQSLPQYFVPVSQQFQAPPQSRETYMAHTVSSSPQVHGQHIRVIQHSNKPASDEENTKQA